MKHSYICGSMDVEPYSGFFRIAGVRSAGSEFATFVSSTAFKERG